MKNRWEFHGAPVLGGRSLLLEVHIPPRTRAAFFCKISAVILCWRWLFSCISCLVWSPGKLSRQQDTARHYLLHVVSCYVEVSNCIYPTKSNCCNVIGFGCFLLCTWKADDDATVILLKVADIRNLLKVPRYRSLFPATRPIRACHLPCWWCLKSNIKWQGISRWYQSWEMWMLHLL